MREPDRPRLDWLVLDRVRCRVWSRVGDDTWHRAWGRLERRVERRVGFCLFPRILESLDE